MGRRIFAISDVHLDYAVNLEWLHSLSSSEYQDDVLILAGDISDSPQLLATCFAELARRFHQVLFVPGNHDLWVLRFQSDIDSLQKFDFVRQLAADNGVSMDAFHDGPLSIVPLLSWYDYSFGLPDNQLLEAWMDFFACKWPQGFDPEAITRHFLALNEDKLTIKNEYLISFSHFMPRIDIMPREVPLAKRYIYPVLGSYGLEKQVRRLGAQMHVYGHSHLNRHVQIAGTTYINNAFGYPSEKRIASKQLLCIYQY